MAYVDVYDAATNEANSLRKKVAVAVVKAVADIRNESAGTANHARRLLWCDRVTADGPQIWAGIVIWRVLENATILANPTTATDNDVQFVVNGLVNYYAGA
jgi:hypothetical protein